MRYFIGSKRPMGLLTEYDVVCRFGINADLACELGLIESQGQSDFSELDCLNQHRLVIEKPASFRHLIQAQEGPSRLSLESCLYYVSTLASEDDFVGVEVVNPTTLCFAVKNESSTHCEGLIRFHPETQAWAWTSNPSELTRTSGHPHHFQRRE